MQRVRQGLRGRRRRRADPVPLLGRSRAGRPARRRRALALSFRPPPPPRWAAMAPTKLLIGGAGAAAVLGIRVARSLQPRADSVRQRPAPTPSETSRQPAPIEPAAAAPDVSADDVASLRDDLRRELERLADADVKASRSGLPTQPRGVESTRPQPGGPSRDPRRIRPDTGAVSAPRGRHARVPRGHQALPGPDRARGRRAQPRGARGRDLRARRAVRLRQDDRHADGQPHDRHHRGRHPARRRERQAAQAGRAAPRHRLRDPADRPLPAPQRGGQHRHGAEAARLEPRTASARASTSCWSSSASTRTRRATAIRPSSPAASASASAWPARSRSTRR